MNKKELIKFELEIKNLYGLKDKGSNTLIW